MWYLRQLPWISPSSSPSLSLFRAVWKKKFGGYALLNIDTLPVALGGKCLRTTCLFVLRLILTCFIILMQHRRKNSYFYDPIEYRTRGSRHTSLVRMRSKIYNHSYQYYSCSRGLMELYLQKTKELQYVNFLEGRQCCEYSVLKKEPFLISSFFFPQHWNSSSES